MVISKTKKNIAYSVILNIVNYATSLITFPYVSRVLNADTLGTIEFVSQAISYFMIFSISGVLAVGTREIAKVGEDRQKRSEKFTAILGLSFLMTVVVLFIYFLLIFLLPEFSRYKVLFVIGSGQLLFTTLQVEWLFRGIEDFRYITIRSVVLRTLFIVALFVFIKKPDDYVLYFGLTIAVVVLNAIINLSYSRKIVSFIPSKNIFLNTWKALFKSLMILCANSAMTSFYSTFNVMYLGIVCNKEEVGYYYVSNKILNVSMGVISAITLVMLPRMSNLVGTGRKDEYKRTLDTTFKSFIDICIPICIGIILYATPVIHLLSGTGYEKAIVPLQIIAPLIFMNAIAQVIVFQVFMPQNKEKIVLYYSIIGALVGVVSNLVFVREMGVLGSAMALFISVLATFVFNMVYALKHSLIEFPWLYCGREFLLSIGYVAIWFLSNQFIPNEWIILLCGGALSVGFWVLFHKQYFLGAIKYKK